MTTETTKAKIRAIFDRLDVGEYNNQVRISQITALAGITEAELRDAIDPTWVRYGLYSVEALRADVAEEEL